MARLAVSQLPREAEQINSGDRFLIDQPSVMNPVTESLGDTRQVSLEVIAGALIGQNSVIDFVDEKVSEETARAEAAENVLTEALQQAQDTLTEAVQQAQDTADSAVEAAAAANAALPGKADKLIIPHTRTLAQADVGDVLGVVTFDTAQPPIPPSSGGKHCACGRRQARPFGQWRFYLYPGRDCNTGNNCGGLGRRQY